MLAVGEQSEHVSGWSLDCFPNFSIGLKIFKNTYWGKESFWITQIPSLSLFCTFSSLKLQVLPSKGAAFSCVQLGNAAL